MIPYQEPDPREAVAREPWIAYVRWTLYFCGAVYLLLGCLFGPFFGALPILDDSGDAPPLALSLFLGALVMVVSFACGVFNFVAAWGLGQGKRWAWIASVIVGGIYAPSGCMPFGALILYGLLREPTRRIFYK
jgi:hypothetical protein